MNPFKFKKKNLNNDTCDSCQEAGNLICCDYCAASFHLSCHDPPLDEKDIPQGMWLCHTCTMKEKIAKEEEEKLKERIKSDNLEPFVHLERISIDNPPIIESINTGSDTPKLQEKITSETDNVTEGSSNEKSPESDDATNKQELSPFEELIRVASLLNPRQFELPVEMTEKFPFPGSERAEHMRNGRRIKTKRLVELDSNGCVPLPAKLCFTCKKSCKRAPLISCDYCSLHFHQDCLDPPMCALPAGRWMCPAHPQQFIDWNLVTTLSATERMKLWDRYAKDPVDHEVIKLQFFRKVHMKNPPFRTKLKPQRIDDIEIPEIVRYQYENPPDLLPSMKQIMRIENLKKRGIDPIDFQKTQLADINQQLDAMETARKKLKTIFSDQEDIHKILEDSEEETEEDVKSPSKSPPPKKSRKSKTDTVEVKDEQSDDKKENEKENVVENDKNKGTEEVEVKIEIDDDKEKSEDTKKVHSFNEFKIFIIQKVSLFSTDLAFDTIRVKINR